MNADRYTRDLYHGTVITATDEPLSEVQSFRIPQGTRVVRRRSSPCCPGGCLGSVHEESPLALQ